MVSPREAKRGGRKMGRRSTRDAKVREAPEATEEDMPKGPASSHHFWSVKGLKHSCLSNALAISGKETHTHKHTKLLGLTSKVTAEKVITLAIMENLK